MRFFLFLKVETEELNFLAFFLVFIGERLKADEMESYGVFGGFVIINNKKDIEQPKYLERKTSRQKFHQKTRQAIIMDLTHYT